jgi:hypothetical protein
MSSKYLFTLLLMLVVPSGCNTFERRQSPNIVAPPPYLQSQNQLVRDQLAEMRAFHEKESAKISEDMHIFHNQEIERLATAGKELEKDRLWQEDYKKTVERREKWSTWFKKKDKGTKNEAPSVSEANKKSVK